MRIAWMCAAVLLAALPATAQDWQQNYRVGSQPKLEVRAADASLNIVAGAGGGIDAHLTTKGDNPSNPHVIVEATQNGDTVVIQVKEKNPGYLGMHMHRSARLDVTVPANTRLTLVTSDGSIHVQGIHASAQLTTSDGSVHVDGTDGELHAHTSDGSITVAGRFDVLDLRTSDGSITADALPGSQMAGTWSLRTSDGSIRLRIPTALAADVDARTSDGHISFDIPITVQGEISKHKLHGRLNGGGHLLNLQTSDGSIQISKQ